MNSFNTFGSNLVKASIIADSASLNNDLYENIGLYGEIAYDIMDDYYAGNPYWFDNTAYINKTGYIKNLDSLQSAVLPLAKLIDNTYTSTTLDGSDRFACQWTGYFKPDYTGTWTFYLDTDNWTNLWIGNTAIYGYTKSNRLITDDYNTNTVTGTNLSAATINLVNGKYYPIRIQWGEENGGISFQFSFSKDGGGTRITNTSSYLYSAKPNLSTLIGMPAVFIKTTPNTVDNLYAPKLFAQYSEKGYHGNSVDFVQDNALYITAAGVRVSRGPAYVANIGDMNEPSTALSFTIPVGNGVHNYFSILYTGYFKADFTGTFIFNFNTDDETYLWIGDYAISGYTTSNRLLYSYADGVTRTGSIYLENGKYYPIRILYGQYSGPGNHILSFTRNGQTITNWTGYTFHPITPLTGNPKMFIDEIVYIGGDASPINSYFTNYIVNIPTGVGLDKYAGHYAVNSSSLYGTGWAPYNVFQGGNNANTDNTEFYPSWHSAGVGSAYKPITNESWTYSQSSYYNGIYRGGGTIETTFYTTYYRTGNTTATDYGEWIQIFVPYNMKLLSYSNRSRYTFSRRPVQYVILGSNDGSTWYALDVVDIDRTSYSPLKKYTINTTTYPYANNYYCYFRYVIKKLEDSDVVNENQWNLVGVKEPINQHLIYIGGKNSPINSYFTNYIVNVPGIGVNKYAGSYEVRSTSYYNNGEYIGYPYNIFKGSDTLVAGEYRPSWAAGGEASTAFKSITNEALNYTRHAYNANGDYVGGNDAVYFPTTYYTSGGNTNTAYGEWVQINVPYNMKLLSYAGRSRFLDCRVPVKYAIIGSNDGSTWYALDVVNIGSWVNYIPLKNYKINTTTYPYANNYYSYFRYVIQKLDSNPNSTISADKEFAHENQWNLVGIKETPNVNIGKTIYIGANSPSNFASYFTSRNVTIPSNFASPEYVGTYIVSESSHASLNTRAYNLFLNKSDTVDNLNFQYSYIWHCGYGGNAYVNDAQVSYNQDPYVNGVYQGAYGFGFGVPYYSTAESTYYTGQQSYLGEWVQIKLPFRMKLTGYSHRTRYVDTSNGRNPLNNAVFGSNDGIIWHEVHRQAVATSTLDTVAVNTTSFKDGIHGYSYFRWAINQLTSGNVANENQLNLIGTRTT
jgi:hypothetical protein